MKKEEMKEALKAIEDIEPPEFNIIRISKTFKQALMNRAEYTRYKGILPPFGSIAVVFDEQIPPNEIHCWNALDFVKIVKVKE